MAEKTVSILVVNSGSSSVKYSLLSRTQDGSVKEVATWALVLESGEGEATLKTSSANKPTTGTFKELNQTIFESVKAETKGKTLLIGHRVTHGVGMYHEPIRLDREVLSVLQKHTAFAPHHLPTQISMMETCLTAFPDSLQYACFDTAFFAQLPRVAQQTGFPRQYEGKGIRRYGFHGLSYTYILGHLKEQLGIAVDTKRCVIAHLGSGASVAAIQGGKPVDTTMGITPNSGLPMSTRLGDLDTGAEAVFASEYGMSSQQFQQMCNFESGLLGVSGYTADMERLIIDAEINQAAEETVAFFSHSVKKQIAGMAAAMGGVDVLVFTGGMGDKAPVIREQICKDLGFLGVSIAGEANKKNEEYIAAPQSLVEVYVCSTNEALVIAQAGSRFVS